MQIEKVYISKRNTNCDYPYFRLRFFSDSSEGYVYGKGFKLTFGFAPLFFLYKKQWKDIKIILFGLRFHYKNN